MKTGFKVTVATAALASVFIGTSASSTADAAVVTFSNLISQNHQYAGDVYQEGGLTFTASPFGSLASYASGSPLNADPGGATLTTPYTFQTALIVSLTGGGAFNLVSFDLADQFNTGAPSIIPFSYTDVGGTHSSNITLDHLVGLQTFTLNLSGISSFSLGGHVQLDNVAYNLGAVPEPSTWAMMILGFGGLGFMAYRRKNRMMLAVG